MYAVNYTILPQILWKIPTLINNRDEIHFASVSSIFLFACGFVQDTIMKTYGHLSKLLL